MCPLPWNRRVSPSIVLGPSLQTDRGTSHVSHAADVLLERHFIESDHIDLGSAIGQVAVIGVLGATPI